MPSRPLTVPELLDRLEAHHGPQQPSWPVDPYESLIWWHCGYPASDAACSRGWDGLKRTFGVDPEMILAAPLPKLTDALKGSGMFPEVRAAYLKEIAQRVQSEFGGELRAALAAMRDKARKALKSFHSIADPGADRILLFARIAPIAAVPSNCTQVLVRIRNGTESDTYSESYRDSQKAIEAEVPRQFHARARAYLLLKEHGQTLCKRTNPKCGECPVREACAYYARSR
jgi:endonuclease III